MAAINERVYVGRDNVIRLRLSEDGVAIDTGTITRVIIIFGGLTVDSQTQGGLSGPVFYTQASGVIQLRLGHVTGIPAAGVYNARLVVYDASNPTGIVWVYETSLSPLKLEVIE